jgi:pentatricopeptide repeat protein
MMLSSSSRAVVRRSIALGRARNSSIRRFKATLQVEREETTSSNHHHHENQGRRRWAADEPLTPQMEHHRVRLDKHTKALIDDVRPGEMTLEEWGDAKYLVSQNCKKGRPEDATKLLERMISECRLHPTQFGLYRSLFNTIISAWAKVRKPVQAEQVFERMMECHQELPNVCPSPDRYSYNALLTSWAGSKSPDAVTRVMQLLNEMEESDTVQPDAYTYNIVMGAYADRVGQYGAAKAAEDILLRFSERNMKGLVTPGPETMSFNIVMKAWSNSRDEKGPDRAMEIYSLMEKLHAEGHEHVRPDSISLIALMTAYSVKGDLDMVEKLLVESDVEGDMTNCYNCAMSSHASSKSLDAGDRAERLLEMMDKPDTTTYTCVLHAHAGSSRKDAASRSEKFLARATENYLKYKTDVRPTKQWFHVVLRAWKSHDDVEEAAKRSLALLRDMQGLANEWQMQTKPDISTYSFVTEMWARVDAQKAEGLLKEVESDGEVPFTRSYNAVLEALGKERSPQAMAQALEVIERMHENGAANAYGYNFVIHAMSKNRSPQNRRTMLHILERMEEGARNGLKQVKPNMLTYTNVLNFLCVDPTDEDVRVACDVFDRMRRLHNDPASKGETDIVGHTIILMLLARARSTYAAEKATEIFDSMLSEDYHVFPDTGCMSSVVLANARAPNTRYTHVAHDRLVNLFRLYLDGKIEHYPYPATVTAVLHAWSKCREEGAAEKGAELLSMVYKMHESGVEGFLPNSRIFSSYFSVLAQSSNNNGGEEAEKMIESLGETDIALWNAVLHIWTRSNRSDKAMKTLRCLHKMIETEGAPIPTQYQYNSILNAAAFTRDFSRENKKEALNVAIETFKEMKASPHVTLDHVSYGSLMKCYRMLMEPSAERAALVREVFEECKEDGYVGFLALRELHACLRPVDFLEAVGYEGSTYARHPDSSLLPREMTRNVPKKRESPY